MTKERASIDFDIPDFEPRRAPEAPKPDEVKALAERTGFTARHAPQAPASTPAPAPAPAPTRFDARSLAKTNRTAKLNIAVSEVCRARFWELAQAAGKTNGEDALIAFMDAYEGKA